MNNEQLKKGMLLKSKIEALKKNINLFKKASEYSISNITIKGENLDKPEYVDIDGFISFSELQNLAIQRMQAKLCELEEEFNKL